MPEPIQVGVPWYKRAGIWIGIATSPGALVVGGGLAAVVPLWALWFTIPIGAFILTSLTIAQGIISRRRRENLPQRASVTFGPGVGSGLINLIMAFSTIGWVSFYLGIAGFSLATLLNLRAWLGVLILLGVSLLLGEIGLNRWNILVWVTTLAALGAAIVALLVVEPKAVPAVPTGFGLAGFLWGVGSVVSYSLVFAVRCSDFTWDMREDADIVKDGLAYFLPVLVMFGIGVTLYRRTGEWNLADILARTDSAELGHIFLVLAVVSPVLTNFHSGTLALNALIGLPKRVSSLVIGLVSFVLGATRFDRQLLPFLDLVGAVLIPALVMMLVMALSSRKFTTQMALTAWVVGSMAALLFKLQGQLIHLVVGALISLSTFYLMVLMSRKDWATEA